VRVEDLPIVDEILRLALITRLPLTQEGRVAPAHEWSADPWALVEHYECDARGRVKVWLASKVTCLELAARALGLIGHSDGRAAGMPNP
jgi:hypothetical protein